MERTLATDLAARGSASASGWRAGCTTSDSWRRSAFVLAAGPERHRAGRARRSGRRAAVSAPDGRDGRRGDGDGGRERPGPRGRRAGRGRRSWWSPNPAAAPPFELRRPQLDRAAPDACSTTPPCRCATLLDGRSRRSRRHRRPGFRSALDQLGFTEIFTPKVVAAATESGANVFPIDWFGRRAYPGAEPAVLQADDGRRVRAGLRGRPGVPCRAPRHGSAPGGVRVARRRDGLHRATTAT